MTRNSLLIAGLTTFSWDAVIPPPGIWRGVFFAALIMVPFYAGMAWLCGVLS